MESPFIIGITGGSGSGKTTFIKQVRRKFSVEKICILSQDDYYRKREEQLCDPSGIKNFDLPGSIDGKAFISDIKKLIEGKVVTRQEYTFNNDAVEPRVLTFHPAPILILEGLFVFHIEKIRELFNLKVFLHAKENLKVIRRIKRDRVDRNYPLEDVLYRYEKHVLPTFEKYIKPYMEEADLVINNNKDFSQGLKVFEAFLQHKLRDLGHE